MNRCNSKLIMAILIAIAIAAPALTAVASIESEANHEFVSYYDQLDVNGKAIYDAINGAGADETSMTVTLPVSLSATASTADEARTLLEATVRQTINLAYDAVRISSPLAYWVWDQSSLHPVLNIAASGNTASLSTVTLTLSLGLYSLKDAEFPGIQQMLDGINAAVDGFSTSSPDIRGKILDINNYLTNLVTYDPNAGTDEQSIYAHDAYGALVAPNHYAVCDGYSKAFLLLCQKYDIECVMILGTEVQNYINHAWNYVKMDNGNWYAVDVTWNDSSNNKYFLAGGETFFTEHQEGIYLGTGTPTYSFTSPSISLSSYDPPSRTGIYLTALAAVVILGAIILIVMYYHGKRHPHQHHDQHLHNKRDV